MLTRIYYVCLVSVAQLVSALFVLSKYPKQPIPPITDLLLWIFSTACAITAGYIINQFYDQEKDFINRPWRTIINRNISPKWKWRAYFSLNFLSVGIASFISLRASLVLSLYIFILWFYSHKIKKWFLIGNMVAACCSLFPFVFIAVMYMPYYKPIIGAHALYLITALGIRELLNDVKNRRGDLLYGYQTIVVRLGMLVSKTILITTCLFLAYFTHFYIAQYETSLLKMYFSGVSLAWIAFAIAISLSQTEKHTHYLTRFLLLILLSGLFFITLHTFDYVKTIL